MEELHLQEFVETLLLISQKLAAADGSRYVIRDIFHQVVEDVKGLISTSIDIRHWFQYQSEIVCRLQVLVADLVKVLGKKVYVHEQPDETLSANEWLLMQNDLAELLELVEVCPLLAECVGNCFGYSNLQFYDV